MMAFSISAMVMSAPGAVYRSSGCKALVSGMFWGPKFEENLSCGTRVCMGKGMNARLCVCFGNSRVSHS